MSTPLAPQSVAIIGGGWAGMAAAVTLAAAGRPVTVFETARHWGGRARGLNIQGPQGQHWRVDNGQHILIGAYTHCLALMEQIGITPHTAMLRQPLDLRDSQGNGLHLPDLPPPWDALLGIARARGWSWAEKTALLLRARRWQAQGFHCVQHASVADLCQGLPQRLLDEFVSPLCISALNLPIAQASGSIFLRVLHDSLFAGRGGSNFLIPTVDMGQLFPDSAAAWLAQRGAQLQLGCRVQHLSPAPEGGWLVNGQRFATTIIATHSSEAARLALLAGQHSAWAAVADGLAHTAIATVYAWAQGLRLPRPMLALAAGPAQFVFDKGQLGGPAGLLAFVVSANTHKRQALQKLVLEQAQQQLPPSASLQALQPLQTVIDKRATFACTPAVQRPLPSIAPGLWACGDYVAGPYPATLEGAVQSAHMVAQAVLTGALPNTTG